MTLRTQILNQCIADGDRVVMRREVLERLLDVAEAAQEAVEEIDTIDNEAVDLMVGELRLALASLVKP